MRVASINLNKRLGNPAVRGRIAAWLLRHNVDVLVAQEPWKPVDRDPAALEGFQPVGGDGRLFTWIAEPLSKPLSWRPCDFAQRIELSWLVVVNVYLDAYAATTRAAQLTELSSIVDAENGRPVVITGDFNIAPRPVDGLINSRASSFNNPVDRVPFQQLIDEACLADATASLSPQFTVTRQQAGRQIQFRCDLALVPRYLERAISVTYDHSTRERQTGFTDHSGILIDLPVSLPAAEESADALFSVAELTGRQEPRPQASYQSHKTAMARSNPSPFARTVTSVLTAKLGLRTLLDHGCGRGVDVAYYRSCGLDADGYDPHPGFNWAKEPQHVYDIVTQVFVLNVLPDPWERIRALRHASKFLRRGGYLFAVTRSPDDIQTRAATSGWPTHHDGYWSSESKGTFQKGISAEEIIAMADLAGLELAANQDLLTPVPAACEVLLVKR